MLRFERNALQADPLLADRPEELAIRAAHLRKAYFIRLGHLSAASRARKASHAVRSGPVSPY
jgi:hypothetical protein